MSLENHIKIRQTIPHLSQMGATASYATGDCGAACLAMILRAMGASHTVDDVSRATGQPVNFKDIHVLKLREVAVKLGLRMYWASLNFDGVEQELSVGRPVIMLVDYKLLPHRFDGRYDAGHYIVVSGIGPNDVEYLDPYWPEGQGRITCTRSELMLAWSSKRSFQTARQALIGVGVKLPVEHVASESSALLDLAVSARWNVEESVRLLERGETERGLDLLRTLIDHQSGTLYQLERGLQR